jgi:hypothetical protein
LADFEVLKWKLEITANVLGELQDNRGLTKPLTEVGPQVCVALIKRVISDHRLGFRGDDLGLTRVNRFDLVISTNDAN